MAIRVVAPLDRRGLLMTMSSPPNGFQPISAAPPICLRTRWWRTSAGSWMQGGGESAWSPVGQLHIVQGDLEERLVSLRPHDSAGPVMASRGALGCASNYGALLQRQGVGTVLPSLKAAILSTQRLHFEQCQRGVLKPDSPCTGLACCTQATEAWNCQCMSPNLA